MSEASFIYFRGVFGGSSHDLGYVVNKHGDRCKSGRTHSMAEIHGGVPNY